MTDTTGTTGGFDDAYALLQELGVPAAWAVGETITGKTYTLCPLPQTKPTPPKDAEDSLTLLSGFQSLETLGEGGMGLIHLAMQQDLHREVALKQIKATRRSPAATKALLHEARVTGALQHPNITPVYALGKDEQGHPVMVMKRIEGSSWDILLDDDEHPTWTRHKRWDPSRIVRHLEILLEVCDAIHFAHSKGILHRDLKPANVMIGDFGEVIVLDWGIALPLDHAPEHLQKGPFGQPPDRIYGTPSYMAPEMAIPKEVLGPTTDVYLLGAILHKILTGQPRHDGKTLKEVLYSVFSETDFGYPSFLPQALVTICKKATAFRPKDRYQNVAELREELTSYLRHRGSIRLTGVADASLSQLKSELNWLAARDSQPNDEAQDTAQQAAQASLQSHFATCQRNFLSALEIWPENEEAIAGYQEATELMFYRAIHTQNEELARGLLHELHTQTQAHHEALVQLTAAIKSARQEKEQLQRIAHEVDINVSGKQRRFFLRAVGLIIFVQFSSVVWRYKIRGEQLHYGRSIIMILVLSVLVGGVVYTKRKALLKNKINRNFLFLFAMVLGSALLNRLASMFQSTPYATMLRTDLLMLILLGTVGAMLLHPAALFGVMGSAMAFLLVSVTKVDLVLLVPGAIIWNWVVLYILFGKVDEPEEHLDGNAGSGER